MPSTPMVRMQSTPKTNRVIRTTAKTPVLTTATACSSALTGVGATIAAGSQPWSGITAHFAKPEEEEQEEHRQQPRVGRLDRLRKNATRRELERSGEVVGQDDCGEEKKPWRRPGDR